MRKAILLTLSTVALAVPSVDAWAASRQTLSSTTLKKKVVVATKSFTGTAAQADRWGNVEVTIVVKKTTTTVGTKKTVARKITKVTVPVYPNHTDRSVYINQQALPVLVQETLHAKMNPNIQLVSGATDTSDAFVQSLQSAILLAKKV
jgi:uncharacterized protein with FMN-binding domain